MSQANGAPEVTSQQLDESQSVVAAPTGIGAMMGVAERGVPDKPVYVESWAAFRRTFGDKIAGSYLGYTAQRALERGCGLWVSRVTAHDGDNVSLAVAAEVQLQTVGGGATKARETGNVAGVLNAAGVRSWPMTSGNKLSFKVDGAGKVTVTISAAAATKSLTNTATFALTNGWTILYRVGPATAPVRTITLDSGDFADISNATPAEIQAVLGRDMLGVKVSRSANVVTLTTDIKGSSARLEFTGGTALSALGLSVEVRVGSGNVADVDYVTVTELNTLSNAADSGVTFGVNGSNNPYLERDTAGSNKTIQFVTSDQDETNGAAVFGFATTLRAGTSNSPVNTLLVKAANPVANGGDLSVLDPGAWANGASGGLAIDTGPATVNSSTRGKLVVKRGGTVVETHDEYSLDPSDDRYLLKLLASSRFITAVDNNAYGTVGTYAAALPATATGTALAGGDDGPSGLVDADYIGDSGAKTGIYAFATAQMNASYIGAPGYTSRDFFTALLAFTSTRQTMMAVGDWPASVAIPQDFVDYRQATGVYVGGAAFNTSFGALYGPWIKVTDTLSTNKGLPKAIPPMGDVFAAFANAKIDGQSTAAGPTAGPSVPLSDVLGLTLDLDLAEVGTIYSAGGNCIINHPRWGICIWGEKTLQAVPSDLDRVPVQRHIIYLRASLQPFFEAIALFQPNDSIQWRRSVDKVNPFLRGEVTKRALVAFRVQNDETVNTPQDVQQHRQNPKVFVKPSLHAEFIELTFVDVAQATNLQ